MSEHAPDRIWSGIEISKVAAGTLAAVSAAVIGSFLGVAGTLIGAAIASVIGSVGTEIYQRSIHRGAKKLQTLAPTFIKAPAAVGTPGVAAATEEDAPSHTVAPEEVTEKRTQAQSGSGLRWKPILVGSVAVFIIAMGAIFAVEAIAGRSLASISGNDDSGRSTLRIPVGEKKATPSPIPSVSPTETEAPATTPTSGAPDTDQPVQPTATNAPQNTEAPTTDAPQETPPTDTQQNDQQPQDDQQPQSDQQPRNDRQPLSDQQQPTGGTE
jgi:hypothetical protein